MKDSPHRVYDNLSVAIIHCRINSASALCLPERRGQLAQSKRKANNVAPTTSTRVHVYAIATLKGQVTLVIRHKVGVHHE